MDRKEVIESLRQQMGASNFDKMSEADLVGAVISLMSASRKALALINEQAAEIVEGVLACAALRAEIDEYAAEIERLKGLVSPVYDAGWVGCAVWADRTDLITDCDSHAYEKDKAEALLRLGIPQPPKQEKRNEV